MNSLIQINKLGVVAVATILVLLSACDNKQDDLSRYIAEVKARPATPIPPIPAVRTYTPYEYEGLTGTETIRACDHQVIKPYYSIKCKGPDAMKTPEDFGDIIGQSTNVLSCEETGCKMA